MLQLSLDAVRGRILRRCEGVILCRSSWPVLLVYLDSVDIAEWRKNHLLVAWPSAATITQRTRLTLHRINYCKAELQAVGLFIRLRHSYVGQASVYQIDADFVPPSDHLRRLDGIPLATPLARDAERGLALRGEGQMMNELGARARLLTKAHFRGD
jgi:hypothetical protein